MVEIVWTNNALTDLEEIAEFIAKDSAKYARFTVDKIFNQTFILKSYPLLGRIVPELNNEQIRELITGNYRIIYEFRGSAVRVLTVHHSARDLTMRSFQKHK